MSDTPAEFRDLLDLRTVIAEIDRKRAEALKLQEEREKFIAEQRKLLAEADKLRWDRRLSPWIIATSLLSGVVVAIISHFWK